MKRLKKIKGDASLRSFIRKSEKNFSSIFPQFFVQKKAGDAHFLKQTNLNQNVPGTV